MTALSPILKGTPLLRAIDMKTSLICMHWILCCALSAAVLSARDTRVAADTVVWVLASPESAISRAVTYAGFHGQSFSPSKGNVQAALETPAVAGCPIVPNKGHGAAVWRVELKDVAFLPEYNKRVWPTQRTRDFTFWIDAGTGKLLRVYSGLPDTLISRVERKPYYVYYEGIREGRHDSDSNVIYHDFPDSLYNMTFCEAVASSASQPFDKGEITAYYITTTWFSKEPRPIWFVDVGGVPPSVKGGGSHEDWNINHVEKLFDARIGAGGMVVAIRYGASD